MKSWADHCSSDEESLMEEIEQELVDETEEEEPVAENETAPEPEPVVVEKTYVFPDKPPFTAFVGNLAYSLKEAEDLKSAIGELTESRLGTPINVLEARVAIDNRTGQHRGFGYLELETLEDVRVSFLDAVVDTFKIVIPSLSVFMSHIPFFIVFVCFP